MLVMKALLGNALIGYYVSNVAYLAEAPHVLLGNRGDFERLIMIYATASTVVWIVAAEFHHTCQSEVFKWSEHHLEGNLVSTDDRIKLLAIISGTSSNEMTTLALATKCFSVTYKHISSVRSVF